MESPPTTILTLPGDPPVAIRLRASARARRITLRVSALDGRVTLTRPAGIPARKALAFAAEKADWLRTQIAGRHASRWPELGEAIPVGGETHVIEDGVPGLDEGRLTVRADRPVAPQVAAVLKQAARARLAAAVSRHANALAVAPRRITLRDTRSRWGSCSGRGDLMFSWRLVMAPKSVLDYVAAHEVAHLVRMDHSPAFWAVCADLCPGWRKERNWLRHQGTGLHAWRFESEDRRASRPPSA